MPRQNLILLFVILLFFTVLTLTFSKLGFLNFAGNFVQNIFAPFEMATRKVFVGEQSELKTQNLELAKKLVDQQKLMEDNKALRDQFETSIINSQNLLPANIVGAPGFIPGISTPETLVLNKGSKDGVSKGQAVIYKDNLVGVISKAGEKYSSVSLIGSSSFNVTAQTLGKEAIGVIKGKNGGQIVLENVLLSQKISKNDLVLTSGTVNEGGFGILPNLIIGKIVSINKDASSLFQTAKIEPLIDVLTLTTLFIVTNQ